jgi:hypothetical protein
METYIMVGGNILLKTVGEIHHWSSFQTPSVSQPRQGRQVGRKRRHFHQNPVGMAG